jgi:hypothetical protein
MSPKVLAALAIEDLCEVVVAQQQAKDAGLEAKWSHRYARLRTQKRLPVARAARQALMDIGIEPMLVEEETMDPSEAVRRIDSALSEVGMSVWKQGWPESAPCLLHVDGNNEFLRLTPGGFYIEEPQPEALFLPARLVLDTIEQFRDLVPHEYGVPASEDEAASLWRLLIRAAGDDVHWADDSQCRCRQCRGLARRAVMS